MGLPELWSSIFVTYHPIGDQLKKSWNTNSLFGERFWSSPGTSCPVIPSCGQSENFGERFKAFLLYWECSFGSQLGIRGCVKSSQIAWEGSWAKVVSVPSSRSQSGTRLTLLYIHPLRRLQMLTTFSKLVSICPYPFGQRWVPSGTDTITMDRVLWWVPFIYWWIYNMFIFIRKM
jgi:hypothetical protein